LEGAIQQPVTISRDLKFLNTQSKMSLAAAWTVQR